MWGIWMVWAFALLVCIVAELFSKRMLRMCVCVCVCMCVCVCVCVCVACVQSLHRKIQTVDRQILWSKIEL